ncbi:MAG: GAF domain-containing protein [Paracoccaceae bacterium]|nr:GAF domain-containing protein [Paracoccaceae bacterium]
MTPEQTFAHAIATARAPIDAFAALDRLVQELLGATLVTVTTVEEMGALARRSYSNMPDAYPTSGIKRVDPSRWNTIVLERHETFVANTLAEIATVFPDHELIGSLGLGSCINMPILLGGEVIATLNLLDAPGYFTPVRVALIADRLTLPALAAQLAYDRLRAR